jgi:hypothetical protein
MEMRGLAPICGSSDQHGRSFAKSKEGTMSENAPRPASSQLHPWVYAAISGLALCYVLSVWFGFASSGYTDWLLTIASFFILGSLALPFIAWRVWHENADVKGTGRQASFRRWAAAEFDIGQGHMRGRTAAIEILLPIAAVAFGMLAFAILARLEG